MESYGGVQRLACDEGGRCAWEARRPRGLAVSKGGWPAGRMNATALVSGRASSRRTRVLLGLAVVGGEGWPPACLSLGHRGPVRQHYEPRPRSTGHRVPGLGVRSVS